MKYIYTTLLLLGSFIASAQSIYRKATITTNDAQILAGYISIHNWDKNPKYIEFKNSPGDKDIKRFYPATIRSFVINGIDEYVTYVGRVSINHTRMRNLPIGRDTASIIDTVFLKLMAKGNNVTLYSYTDKIKTRFFISEKQDLPHELLFQQYYNELHKIRTVNLYSGELGLLIIKYTDTTELFKRMDSTRYNVDDMQDVVNGINHNKKPKVSRSHTRMYAGAALTINNLSYLPIEGSYRDANYGKQVANGPKISIGIDLMRNIDIQGFIYRLELSADKFDTQFSGLDKNNLRHDYSFTQKNVSITTQAIWNIYNQDAFKFYISAGIGLAIERSSGDDHVVPASALSDFTYNVPLQAGVVFNRQIELFFSGTAREPSYTGPIESLRSNTYNIGFHYLFEHRYGIK